jgi:hypothetical protein
MNKFSSSVDFVKHGWTGNSLVIRTTNRVTFESDKFGVVVIPHGSLSDGASVPRIFWNIFSPFDGDYFDAAVLHDVIYRDNLTKYTRAQADAIFLEAMESVGVGWCKRRIVYHAVRLAGWKPWNENRT